MIAGVVNLNTQQAPVLQALLSNAYIDEAFSSGTSNTGFTPITGAQAAAMLTTTATTNLLAVTSSTNTTTGEGPFENVSELVGRYIPSLLGFTGPSADLTNIYTAAFSGASTLQTMQQVDRFRESFIRPLAAVGNTRLWNLMIDLVVQDGQYASNATTLDNFTETGEQRYWLHEAIDRYTGQVVDQNLETVGPSSISLTASAINDSLPAGTPIATLNSAELLNGGFFTYALVSSTSYPDNSSFYLTGNVLNTAAVFNYFTKTSYTILLGVTDQDGLTWQQPVTITVTPSPYTQWKINNFGSNANNPTIAGDLVDSQKDGVPNLLKYALGKSPLSPSVSGITVHNNGTQLIMYYTQASAATDVTVTASVTTALNNAPTWSPSGVTQTMLSDDGTIQQWQATAPISSNHQLFMQLSVTHQ